MVMAEPIRAFNRDPNDLVVTTGDRLVVNHLLEHDFLSQVEVGSLLEVTGRVSLTKKAPIFNEKTPRCGQAQGFRGPPHGLWQLCGSQPPQAQPPQVACPEKDSTSCLGHRKEGGGGGGGGCCAMLDMAEISCYDHVPQHCIAMPPPPPHRARWHIDG